MDKNKLKEIVFKKCNATICNNVKYTAWYSFDFILLKQHRGLFVKEDRYWAKWHVEKNDFRQDIVLNFSVVSYY